MDEEDGLYYYGGRYYDAEIGRFVSVDPMARDVGIKNFKDKYGKELVQLLSSPQELNLYAYVAGNPIKYIDPNGEALKDYYKVVKDWYANWKMDQEIKEKLYWSKQYSQAVEKGGNLGARNSEEFRQNFENILEPVMGFTSAPEGVANIGKAIVKKVINGTSEINVSKIYKETGLVINEGHPIERMMERGVNTDTFIDTIKNSETFKYIEKGREQIGYYCEKTKIFVGKVENRVTTIITDVKRSYIDNLKNKE